MASRIPSPTAIADRTTRAIMRPGGTHSHGIEDRTVRDCASFCIFPQLDCGGWTPAPRNDSEDSSSTDSATSSVAETTMGGKIGRASCREREESEEGGGVVRESAERGEKERKTNRRRSE